MAGSAGKEWTIDAGSEYRFEVAPPNQRIILTLLDGQAEIFGTELAPRREYEFGGGEKLAVFSYEGARISVRSGSTVAGAGGETCPVEYVSAEVPMQAYLNTHLSLQELRRSEEHEPKVLVLGTSRKTVSRILANYAARQGETPILVDLDVSAGMLVMPGVLAAHAVARPIDLEEGVSADGQPDLAYFYGHTGTKDSAKTFKKLMARLAEAVLKRLDAMHRQRRFSGVFVVAPGDADEPLIEEIQRAFHANVVLVIGNERLHSSLQKRLSSSAPPLSPTAGSSAACTVLKLPKSGGVVAKDAAYRRFCQQRQFKTYFYGARGEFSPFSITLAVSSIRIYRFGHGTRSHLQLYEYAVCRGNHGAVVSIAPRRDTQARRIAPHSRRHRLEPSVCDSGHLPAHSPHARHL